MADLFPDPKTKHLLITQDQYAMCLNELRVYFKTIRHRSSGIQDSLKDRMAKILRNKFPNVSCHVKVDMEDPEHPKVTITQVDWNALKCKRVIQTTKYDEIKSMLQKRYGDRLGLFLTNRLAGMIRKRKLQEASIDNLRISRIGYTSSELRYNELRASGCCGFADQEFTYRSQFLGLRIGTKSTWRIGFNYGH